MEATQVESEAASPCESVAKLRSITANKEDFMFQDEKTTELDLNAPLSAQHKGFQNQRWTENSLKVSTAQNLAPYGASSTAGASLDHKHLPWLVKLAAAVSILILSIWLF